MECDEIRYNRDAKIFFWSMHKRSRIADTRAVGHRIPIRNFFAPKFYLIKVPFSFFIFLSMANTVLPDLVLWFLFLEWSRDFLKNVVRFGPLVPDLGENEDPRKIWFAPKFYLITVPFPFFIFLSMANTVLSDLVLWFLIWEKTKISEKSGPFSGMELGLIKKCCQIWSFGSWSGRKWRSKKNLVLFVVLSFFLGRSWDLQKKWGKLCLKKIKIKNTIKITTYKQKNKLYPSSS